MSIRFTNPFSLHKLSYAGEALVSRLTMGPGDNGLNKHLATETIINLIPQALVRSTQLSQINGERLEQDLMLQG